MSKNTLLSELINYISANASGNVVIAAPSSGYALDVTGTGRFTGQLTGTTASFSSVSTNPIVTLKNSDGDTEASFAIAQGVGLYLNVYNTISTRALDFKIGGSSAVIVTNNRNVLIGTTSDAGYKLDVAGTGRFTGDVTFEGGTGAINFTASTTITNTASSGFTAIYANGGGIYLGGSASVNHLSIASGGAATFSSSVTASGDLTLNGNRTIYLTNAGTAAGGIVFYNSTGSAIKSGIGSYYNVADEGDLEFLAGGSSTKMIIRSSGNVGIGTTAPQGSYMLTICGDSSSRTGGITFRQTSTDTFYMGNPAVTNTTDFELWNPRDGYTRFATNNTERMRITSGGNVLIGTTTDISYRVNVSGSVYLSNVLSIGSYFEGNCNFSSYTNDGLFSANARPSTITTPSGSQRIKLGYFDYGGGQYYGRIGFAANTNWSLGTIGSAGNDFGIGTGASGQILTITSAGNIGMGVNSPSHRLQVSGNIYSTDTVFGRNLKPEAFVSVNAGTPSGAGIPLGYSTIGISTITDGNWRAILTNINDVKGYFWVTLGDAASKDTANYMMAMTSPAYGVSNFGVVSYQDNGWNTGGFEFTTDTTGGTYRLLVRCTSYYSGSATAYGTIYFLRLE